MCTFIYFTLFVFKSWQNQFSQKQNKTEQNKTRNKNKNKNKNKNETKQNKTKQKQKQKTLQNNKKPYKTQTLEFVNLKCVTYV